MKTILRFLLCVILIANPADARRHAGGLAQPTAPPVTTCPNGLLWATYDDCQEANPSATFQSASLPALYVVRADGVTPGTLNHFGTDYNIAGYNFPVGNDGGPFKDPFTQSFSATGSSYSTVAGVTTVTFGTVTDGVITNGMTLFPGPGTGKPANHPTLSNCTGSGSGAQCTLSSPITSGALGNPIHGSFSAPCYWHNGGAGLSSWTCTFKFPNNQLTAFLDHPEMSAVGGHTASTLRVADQDNGFSMVKISNMNFVMDALSNTSQISVLNTATGVNVGLDLEDSTCDGGNAATLGTAPVAPFTYGKQTACVSWVGRGLAGGGSNILNITLKRNNIFHFAGNPVLIDLGYTCVLAQANVLRDNGVNGGNGGTTTGTHGAGIQFGTSLIGATNYCLHRYNNSYLLAPNFPSGIWTAPMALLCGVASALTVADFDSKLENSWPNISNNPGHATVGQHINAFRCGTFTSVKMNHNFWNNVGSAGCFSFVGDLQQGTGASYSFSSTSNAGTGTSTGNMSGFIGSPASNDVYPGQTEVYNSTGSQAPAFYGTLTASGANSTLTINSWIFGTTTFTAGEQVVGLRSVVDPSTHPTVIVSQTDATHYVVTNGTGSGENQAQQAMNGRIHVIQPFGTVDPGTGLPSTMTGGTTAAGYNGTIVMGGLQTVPASDQWSSVAAAIGNSATIDTDVSDNWDIQTAGNGGKILPDGQGLNYSACPNINPA